MNQLDNDMDELFRNAAEKYPLRTAPMNWDDISPVVINDVPITVNNKKKWHISGILLLMLSMFSLTLLLLFFNDSTGKNGRILSKHQLNSSTTSSSNSKDSIHDFSAISIRKKVVAPTARLNTQLFPGTFMLFGASNPSTSNIESSGRETLFEDKTDVRFKSPSINLAQVSREIGSFRFQSLRPFDLPMDSVVTSGALYKVSSKTNHKRPGLYLGLEGSLQLNEVQTQGFSKLGFGAGIIAGYQFNKRLAFETGIAWSRKCYYTDAKYFEMGNASAGMPANMKVISLNSTINVFEIPIKAKYNFRTSKKSNGFVTAGFSSYLLTKESNNYLAILNGQQRNVAGNYTDNKKYFSAVVQLGLGYEYKVGRKSLVRAEPYLQIPLKGIGVGALQVMTAGIHIGVTKFTRK